MGDTQPIKPAGNKLLSENQLKSDSGQVQAVTPSAYAPREHISRSGVPPVKQNLTDRRYTRGGNHTRRQSRQGLYLPCWSLFAMFFAVAVMMAFLIAVLIGLGSINTPTPATPVLRIITGIPPTAVASAFTGSQTGRETVRNSTTAEGLPLAGPELSPVLLTATPISISLGATIAVEGVDEQKLNVRDVPGTRESSILFRADEEERFIIAEGPRQADGFTWWRIQDPSNPTRTGWAVSNYLLVISAGQ